ncbi:MAG: hypothetical protein MR779_01160 [Tenericutes bacterium]|nr:hypothetical protein [Mycoplasmatota bacterium]
MNNKYRIIFWGTIMVILIGLGVYGIICNFKIFNDKKPMITEVLNIFDRNETINKYREYNTNITSKLDSKKAIITFSGTFDNVYELKYKSGYLELEIDKNDAVGLNVAMVMLDSVAVYYGEEETSTYDTFKSNRIYDMNLNDGVKVIINTNTYVYRISLNNHIK